ncbi:uncharacterized protein LOC144630592 [Oculina patagonica]
MAGVFHVSRISWQAIHRLYFSSPLLKNAFSFHSCAKIYKQVKFLRTAVFQSQLQQVSLYADHSTCAENEDKLNSRNEFVHPDERTVFVGKLNPISTEQSIEEYFSQFGEVERVSLKPSKKLNKIWPYAYVEFKDVSSVEKVLAQDHQIHMRSVRVAHAQQNDRLRLTKICVRNIPIELDELHLKEHFSQFGEIIGVEFAHNNPKVVKERYCFVEFTTPSAVVSALESPTQKIGQSFVEVKKFTARPKRTYIKGRAIIEVVPEGLKVEHLRDYFKQFGRLAFVDLIFHRSHYRSRDIAFIGFFDDEPVETIAGEIGCHTIKGKEVIVKRAISDKGNKDRKVKIFVDRIPGMVTENDVRWYFEAFGDIMKMHMKRWGGKENLQSAILTFSDIAEVDGIMARPKHSIDGQQLIVKRIGWSA